MSSKLPAVALVLLFAALALVLAWPAFRVRKTIDVKSRERNTAAQLVAALKHYKLEHGEYPSGDHAVIMRALRGENPRKIVFFEAKSTDFNERGELVDRWRTPYRIEPEASPIPHVSSAGKNRKFEGEAPGSDDILSWN